MMRIVRVAAGFLLLALILDASLLWRAALDQRPDALPTNASLIVLDAWASDSVTRQAFDLAQHFDGALLLSVGPPPERPQDLAAEGVCLPGTSFAAKTRAQLLSWGVPEDRVILLEQDRRGTHDQAQLVLDWWRQRGGPDGTVIVVTEWFHRQRSRLAYRTVMPEVPVRVAGDASSPNPADWPLRDRRTSLFSEFLKLAYYQSKGLISMNALAQSGSLW
ncbi:YdcF family protein [Methyloterricola oryzae]|uniref:YdcF family protein n=1 Tax=Methyloterricola oryzae TaxID=1495050 RepID=UPI0005EBEBB7|nr:ElyC/SanA/YdcF family protein [Methyloterricola oryzae]